LPQSIRSSYSTGDGTGRGFPRRLDVL